MKKLFQLLTTFVCLLALAAPNAQATYYISYAVGSGGWTFGEEMKNDQKEIKNVKGQTVYFMISSSAVSDWNGFYGNNRVYYNGTGGNISNPHTLHLYGTSNSGNISNSFRVENVDKDNITFKMSNSEGYNVSYTTWDNPVEKTYKIYCYSTQTGFTPYAHIYTDGDNVIVNGSTENGPGKFKAVTGTDNQFKHTDNKCYQAYELEFKSTTEPKYIIIKKSYTWNDGDCQSADLGAFQNGAVYYYTGTAKNQTLTKTANGASLLTHETKTYYISYEKNRNWNYSIELKAADIDADGYYVTKVEGLGSGTFNFFYHTCGDFGDGKWDRDENIGTIFYSGTEGSNNKFTASPATLKISTIKKPDCGNLGNIVGSVVLKFKPADDGKTATLKFDITHSQIDTNKFIYVVGAADGGNWYFDNPRAVKLNEEGWYEFNIDQSKSNGEFQISTAKSTENKFDAGFGDSGSILRFDDNGWADVCSHTKRRAMSTGTTGDKHKLTTPAGYTYVRLSDDYKTIQCSNDASFPQTEVIEYYISYKVGNATWQLNNKFGNADQGTISKVFPNVTAGTTIYFAISHTNTFNWNSEDKHKGDVFHYGAFGTDNEIPSSPATLVTKYDESSKQPNCNHFTVQEDGDLTISFTPIRHDADNHTCSATFEWSFATEDYPYEYTVYYMPATTELKKDTYDGTESLGTFFVSKPWDRYTATVEGLDCVVLNAGTHTIDFSYEYQELHIKSNKAIAPGAAIRFTDGGSNTTDAFEFADGAKYNYTGRLYTNYYIHTMLYSDTEGYANVHTEYGDWVSKPMYYRNGLYYLEDDLEACPANFPEDKGNFGVKVVLSNEFTTEPERALFNQWPYLVPLKVNDKRPDIEYGETYTLEKNSGAGDDSAIREKEAARYTFVLNPTAPELLIYREDKKMNKRAIHVVGTVGSDSNNHWKHNGGTPLYETELLSNVYKGQVSFAKHNMGDDYHSSIEENFATFEISTLEHKVDENGVINHPESGCSDWVEGKRLGAVGSNHTFGETYKTLGAAVNNSGDYKAFRVPSGVWEMTVDLNTNQVTIDINTDEPPLYLFMHGNFWNRHFDLSWPCVAKRQDDDATNGVYVYEFNDILITRAGENSTAGYFMITSNLEGGPAEFDEATDVDSYIKAGANKPAAAIHPNDVTEKLLNTNLGDRFHAPVYEFTKDQDQYLGRYKRATGDDVKAGMFRVPMVVEKTRHGVRAKVDEVQTPETTVVDDAYVTAKVKVTRGTGTTISLTSSYNGPVTGIENVDAAGAEEVEYFNLQGQRVANPGTGVYIRRQGSTVSKVTM